MIVWIKLKIKAVGWCTNPSTLHAGFHPAITWGVRALNDWIEQWMRKWLTHPSSVVSSGSCIGGWGVSSDSQPVGFVFFLILDVATDSTFKVALAWEGTCGANTHLIHFFLMSLLPQNDWFWYQNLIHLVIWIPIQVSGALATRLAEV